MTGQLNYAVKNDYRIPTIESYADYMSVIDNSYGHKSYKGLKMMSVLGNSDGGIGLRVNRWGDGSGDYSNVTFFKTYEEAKSFVKSCALKLLEKSSLGVEEFQHLKKIGIEFSREEMLLIRTNMQSSCDKHLENVTAIFTKQKEKAEADKAYIDQQLNVI